MRFALSVSGKQQGLSMIEVLVAVTILSIGLLGTAALQMQSKRANLGSVEHTLASMLINDMFERMRANPGSFAAYLAELDEAKKVGESSGTAPIPDCEATACTPTELAERDVWEWEQLLLGATEVSGTADTGGLVLPLACMTGPAGGGAGVYTIAVNWRGQSEFTDASSPDPCNISGLGGGRYDGESGNDTLRRVIVVSSYLDE